MASKTITAFERVVFLFGKTFVCTNINARRLCALQCFYIQHADCAVDIILSFYSSRTTPVRGYWDSQVWHGYIFQTKNSGLFCNKTCVLYRKIPVGLFLYPITAAQSTCSLSFTNSRKSLPCSLSSSPLRRIHP